ncbi:MAG: hypothetical protein M3115_03345 [Thermoproteota archaeon]|nr:hypothetical protein [Thermoproteota archaeon]
MVAVAIAAAAMAAYHCGRVRIWHHELEAKMGHGAICSNKKCSHRLGLHQYDNKKGHLCARSADVTDTSDSESKYAVVESKK